MKKILLGTTGLVGAALLATAASAETPKVTLGGFSDFQAGYTDNDLAGDDSDVGFRNDNEISVRVDGKTDAGLGYGAVIDLEADISGDNDNEGTNAARTFTYLEGGWGRVELGGNKGAASTMRVDASTLAVATGGINGDWNNFVDPTGNTGALGGGPLGGVNPYVTSSELQGEHGSTTAIGDESTINATKITYYSPRWSGFQVGASYTPDLAGRGQLAARDNTIGNNVWDLAAGYETQFDDATKLALSGTYTMGDAPAAGGDDLEGWNVGALLGIWGFNFAGSYGQWNEVAGTAGDEADYWTAGVGYDMGAIGLSATYLDSTYEVAGAADNDFNNLVLGADYKLAPGLTPYAEVSFYEFDGAVSNDGTQVLVGTQLAF